MPLLQKKNQEAQEQAQPELQKSQASPFMKPATQARFEATVRKIYWGKPQASDMVITRSKRMRDATGTDPETFYGADGLAWRAARRLFMDAAKSGSTQTSLKAVIDPLEARLERIRRASMSRGLPVARERLGIEGAGTGKSDFAVQSKGTEIMQNELMRLDRVYKLLGGLDGQPYGQGRFVTLSKLVGAETWKSWGVGDFKVKMDCSGTATALLILSGVSMPHGMTSDYYYSLRRNPDYARSAEHVQTHEGVYVWAKRGHVAFAISDGAGKVYWNEAHQPGMAYTAWSAPHGEGRGTYLEFARK